MAKRTKIVATLGPATDRAGVLEEILRAGADVLRVNFSHGSPEDRRRRVREARAAAARLGRDIGVLGDLQGPKIRIERFAAGPVELREGERFSLDASLPADAGDSRAVGVTYKALPQDVRRGDVLLLADGLVVLEVEKVSGQRVDCVVRVGGMLSDGKGINRQGGGLSAGALIDKDREDIRTAAELELDFLAVSLPRSAADIITARGLLQEAGGRALVVAKIERAEALDRIEEIAEASDAVMVARGDLGVEIGYAEVPGVQKRIIRIARSMNRVVITATQMMESMVHEPIPTRAEVSDVANAVIDGTDAVMLSAETAVGRHPVRAVEAMASACVAAEKERVTSRSRHRMDKTFCHTDEAIAMATMYTANHMDVRAIVALTESGSTVLWMSRIRSGIPIYAFSRNQASRRRVSLYRGVYPVPFDVLGEPDLAGFSAISRVLLERGLAADGDRILFTEGHAAGVSGGTNTMRILTVGADSSATGRG
jgi:pyruvate kinase